MLADLFDLERDDVASARQVGRAAAIVPGGFDAAVDNEARGAAGIGAGITLQSRIWFSW